MGETARMLGKPLMPWQQYVADVVLEIDPATGLLVYQEWGLTVPRQSGKSTFILAKATQRAVAAKFFGARQRLVYTAQTRQKAREKWEEDYAAELEHSRTFASRVQVHKGNGNEHIRFQNGSRFGIEANTEKAGHGGTIDEAYIDEAFAQPDGRLEQAFRPAMITRRNKQLGWVSTAGWLGASPYLEGKTRRGREQVELGIREGLAYFEWSAPDDADPYDRSVWRDCMPALGHTISEGAIAGELASMAAEGKLNDFRRAYLNQWVPKSVTSDAVIPTDSWSRCLDVSSRIDHGYVFAVDVNRERSESSVAVAGWRADGLPHVEVVEKGPGTEWVGRRLEGLVDSRGGVVAVDAGAAAGSLLPEFRDRGLPLEEMTARDYVQACGGFYDAAMQGRLRHIGQAPLDVALGAAQRRMLEAAWAWDRKSSREGITPLVSVTLALHLLVSASKPAEPWVFYD